MEATALSDLRHGVLGKSAGKQAIARYDSLARRRDLLRHVRGRRNHEEKRNVIDVEIEGIGRLTNAFVQ
jgi:hypothetical protein